MDFEELLEEIRNPSDQFKKDVSYAVLSLLVGLVFVAGHNVTTPNDTTKVGYVEVSTSCFGLDAGVCLGVEKRSHTTYNYDNYQEVEKGTENYYRRIESELMLRAYNTCSSNVTGMEWTDEVSYKNKTASEWAENDNIDLLPCSQTFYRPLKSGQ